MNDDYIQNLINQLETATKEQVIYFATYVNAVGYVRHELWAALCKAMDKYEINYQYPFFLPIPFLGSDIERKQFETINNEMNQIISHGYKVKNEE